MLIDKRQAAAELSPWLGPASLKAHGAWGLQVSWCSFPQQTGGMAGAEGVGDAQVWPGLLQTVSAIEPSRRMASMGFKIQEQLCERYPAAMQWHSTLQPHVSSSKRPRQR